MTKKVLVVDDQPLPRRALCNELLDVGFEVEQAEDGEQGWQVFQTANPDVVVTDLSMPQSDGLELLSRIRGSSEVPVILFSAYGTVQSTAAAFKAGAHDFLSSTEVDIDDLVSQIKRAVEQGDPKASDLTSRIQPLFAGESTLMCDLRGRLSTLASFPIPVFVVGPPGSGRDQAFRILHDMGPTEGEDFAVLKANSPLPDFDSLTPGSIYLDGLEDFSPESLDEWAERLDRIESDGFDQAPRIFASSARPLADWRSQEGFCQGLGRHLLASAIELPSVQDHPEDLPEIARVLCRRLSERASRRIRLSPAATRLIAEKEWKGEVAELERILERAITFTLGPQVRRDTVRNILRESEQSVATYRNAESARERFEVMEALRKENGNISRVASLLGRSRSAIYRMIDRHGIALDRNNTP
ncbi:response regulator [Myxococcota bacterium]|nr:response regulator [Myxococcota bacterium]